MKRFLTLLLALCASFAFGQSNGPFPTSTGQRGWFFRGKGINCHSTRIATADAAALGITWFRVDNAGFDLSTMTLANANAYIDEVLSDYGGPQHVLWMLYQGLGSGGATVNANATIIYNESKKVYGIPCPLECYNEAVQHGMSVSTYITGYNSLRAAIPLDCLIIGGVDEPPFDLQLFNGGLRPDGWSIHAYSLGYAGIVNSLKQCSAQFASTIIETEGNQALVTISGTSANGVNPCICTTAVAHGYTSGDKISISGATGNTAINCVSSGGNPTLWTATVIDSTHFSIPVAANGTYNASTATTIGQPESVTYFTGWSAAIGNNPALYYDGPFTDASGLWGYSGSNTPQGRQIFNVRTAACTAAAIAIGATLQ